MLGLPQGASDFIERANINQHLTYRKPAGQFRIFVYGESTVHGAGYAPTSSPVKWLDAYLKDFLPGRDIKVVNYGRLGAGSAFIAQAFLDTLQFKPDLAIFYLGHNTFYLENRVATVNEINAKFTSRFKLWLHKSRLVSAIVREVIKVKIRRHSAKPTDVMGTAVIETIISPEENGKDKIALPGSPLYQENVQFFKGNIEKIIGAGKEAHVPVLFMKPVCNLKNYPPNISVHFRNLTGGELEAWDKFYREGLAAAKEKDDFRALDLFEKAYAIDPSYADLSFHLGQLYFKRGDLGEARDFFEQARDHDAVIRRAPKDILNYFDELHSQGEIHYFDTEKSFLSRTPGGIPGWPLIEDNVHFSIKGQALAARALADEIASRSWIAPRSEWRFHRERSDEEIKRDLGITDKTLFLNYCSVFGYMGRRFDERLEFAQKAIALFPDNPTALRQLAWGYWLTGDKAKALAIYRSLSKKYPDALEAAFRAQPELRTSYEAVVLKASNFGETP